MGILCDRALCVEGHSVCRCTLCGRALCVVYMVRYVEVRCVQCRSMCCKVCLKLGTIADSQCQYCMALHAM